MSAPERGMAERRFNVMVGRGSTTIPWGLATLLYPAYGHSQTLERIHERGGFSLGEIGLLSVDNYHDGHPRLKRMPLLELYECALPEAEAAALVDVAEEARALLTPKSQRGLTYLRYALDRLDAARGAS